MKLRALFNEAISLTHLKPELVNTIKGAIRKCLRVATRRQFENNQQLLDAINNSFHNSLALNIADTLWSKQDKYGAYATFDNIKVHGQAKRKSIVLSHKLVDDLINKLNQKAESVVLYDKIENLNSIADDPFVAQHINKLADTIIHEFVHTTQHTKQPENKPTEYRSYLTKNKEEFYQAVKNLETEQDWRLYLSSPQEIPAHAHNFALELINFLWEHPIENINDPDIGYRIIANIDEVFKWNNIIQGMQRHQMYQRFKKPGTYEYKVFKRFMTAAYKELQNFKQLIVNRINEIS